MYSSLRAGTERIGIYIRMGVKIEEQEYAWGVWVGKGDSWIELMVCVGRQLVWGGFVMLVE